MAFVLLFVCVEILLSRKGELVAEVGKSNLSSFLSSDLVVVRAPGKEKLVSICLAFVLSSSSWW